MPVPASYGRARANSRGKIRRPRPVAAAHARDAPGRARCRILTLMAYPKNLIQDGETVALDLRPHWWYFSRNILTGIPLFFLVVIVLANVDRDSTLGQGTYWVVALVFLAWAAWLVLKYFQWVMTYFVVTSRRVIYRTGVLSKKGVEIPLERINNINFHQRIIDRIIGAGDLDIESAGVTARATSTSCAIPTACSTRSTARWRPATCRRTSRARGGPATCARSALGAGTGRERARPDRAARAPARPGAHHPEEYEQKKSELLGRM